MLCSSSVKIFTTFRHLRDIQKYCGRLLGGKSSHTFLEHLREWRDAEKLEEKIKVLEAKVNIYKNKMMVSLLIEIMFISW